MGGAGGGDDDLILGSLLGVAMTLQLSEEKILHVHTDRHVVMWLNQLQSLHDITAH